MPATEVPAGVQHLLEVLVGSDWPGGDPGELRQIADQWRATAKKVETVQDLVRAGVRQVDSALEGRTREEFDAFIAPLTAESGYLDAIRQTCLGLADALDEMAVQIEMLRILIIELLVLLAIQIAAEIAAAPFTFGASLESIPGEMAATRAVVVTVLRRAVIGLISHLAASLLEQVGVVFLDQFILICQHKLSGFRGDTFKTAAINATVGGAVGLGVGALGGLAKAGTAKSLREHIPAARHFDGTAPKTWKDGGKHFAFNAPLDIGWGAATGAAEAAAQDAATGSTGDEVYGAENGAFTGARDAGHNAFNPHSKFSTNPAYYLDKKLNGHWDKTRTPPTTSDDRPPRLPPLGREDWDTWARDTLGALDS
ncbi:WXG100 family type VII secretion target [Amycolatopsis minnesotensis]|uniref:Outer membrane channel protein CpnT-like N-terminal domain-containing protein n=1 Tax=Amycolatopsis minnesotensis TaxID=337894 RepID=A0ABN2S881_9PSEU